MLSSDPIDELVQRAHNESQGAPPEFMGRLRARMLAEGVARKRARLLYIQAAAAVAAVIVIAVVIGFNFDRLLPTEPKHVTQPEAAKSNAAPVETRKPDKQPAPNQPDVGPEPQPEPQPTPQPEERTPEQPEPKVPDAPQPQPEPEPEQPKPEPKPDDVVKKPDPQPEIPKQPEGTEVKPEKRLSAQASVIGTPKLSFRYGEGEWRDYEGAELEEGVALRAGREAVNLALSGGGLARFDGELIVEREADAIRFRLIEDSLYIDNLETSKPVIVFGGAQVANLRNTIGLLKRGHQSLEAACIAGDLWLADAPVAKGFVRVANLRGVGDPKSFKGDRLLADLPPRVLLREDFIEAPPGGLYGDGERIESGVVVQERQPGYIAFRYNPTLTVLPGMVLRMRIRTTAASKLELELFTNDAKQRMYKHVWTPAKNGEWQELEFRVEEIPENDDPESFPVYGTPLRNFKLHFTGKKLEIDWVEFVREQN